jgi:hypothetical protein
MSYNYAPYNGSALIITDTTSYRPIGFHFVEFHPESCTKCKKTKYKYILPKCIICECTFCYKHCFRCINCQQYYCFKCVPKNRTKKINKHKDTKQKDAKYLCCVYCNYKQNNRCILC